MGALEKAERVMSAAIEDIMGRYANIEYADPELLEEESYDIFSDASAEDIAELLSNEHPAYYWVDVKAAVRAVFDRCNESNDRECLKRLTEAVAESGEDDLYSHYRDLLVCELDDESFIAELDEILNKGVEND